MAIGPIIMLNGGATFSQDIVDAYEAMLSSCQLLQDLYWLANSNKHWVQLKLKEEFKQGSYNPYV